jgi:nicotinate phosphoribosyltransferase
MPAKITSPGRKRLVRYRDVDGRPLGDVMYLVDETALPAGPRVPYVGHHDLSFVMQLEGVATQEELLVPMMEDGRRVVPRPTLAEVRARAAGEVASLPDELKRLRNPEIYQVGLSTLVARTKATMIQQAMGGFTWRNGPPGGSA